MEDVETILGQRQKTYGDFTDVAHRAQTIKAALRTGKNWDRLTTCQRETLEMVANKLGRILEGDSNHRDGWIDCAGYFQLVVNYLDAKED